MRKYDFLYSILLAAVIIFCYHFFFTGEEQFEKQILLPPPIEAKEKNYDENVWRNITDYDQTILLDIRYATKNNFVEEIMYDCGKCFLRPKVADALIKANIEFGKKGYRIKVFDCYRPKPVQQALWDRVPDAKYVTPPHLGSMHNRGAAVDVSLVDDNGYELNMGTGYDFFGEQAHHDFTDFPEDILENRNLLKSVMESFGFKSIRTEWWHYSFEGSGFDISEWLWSCD